MQEVSRERSLIAAWSYAFPALPLSALALSFYVYLPKAYTDLEGVSLGAMGVIILLSRIWDAFLDPWIGRLSDRSLSAHGRRRPWMFLGCFPLAAGVFFLFSPEMRPVWCSADYWFAAWAFLFFFFWTLVNVPYEALGAELSNDYHERTSILAKRDGMVLLGTLCGGALPEIVHRLAPATATEELSRIGVIYGVLVALSVFLCVSRLRERARAPENESAGVLSNRGVMSILGNKPFLVLIASYGIGALGAALPASLILYYVEDVLQSDKGPLFLVLYLLTGFLCLPLWVLLSRRIEKKTTWLLSMAVNTLTFSLVFFLGRGDELWYGILVVLSGIGVGATLAIPSSMQADVIDYDEWQTGARREGLYVGLWSIVKKASAAIGAGLGFLLLERAGYVPTPGIQTLNQSSDFALRGLYAGVPSACNLLAIFVALPYALSKVEHERIRREIEGRQNGQ